MRSVRTTLWPCCLAAVCGKAGSGTSARLVRALYAREGLARYWLIEPYLQAGYDSRQWRFVLSISCSQYLLPAVHAVLNLALRGLRLGFFGQRKTRRSGLLLGGAVSDIASVMILLYACIEARSIRSVARVS